MTARRHLRFILLTLAITLPLSVLTGLRLGSIFTQPDSTHYLELAQSRPAMLPFASRQLAPLIVRALTRFLALHTAFYVEGVAALLIFACAIAYLLARSHAALWAIPATLGLFFWSQEFHWLVLPDLLYAALLSCFLLALFHRQLHLAALILFPLTLTRESTLLTVACFFLALFWNYDRKHRSNPVPVEREEPLDFARTRNSFLPAATAIIATASGLLLVHHLTRNALPNHEHLPPALYLLAKLPWNFFKNILGITPWSNVYPACAIPRWQLPLHLGPVQTIGFCGFDFTFPIKALAAALAAFGLLPLLLFRMSHLGRGLMAAEAGSIPSHQPTSPGTRILLSFTLLYGTLSFLLAPLLGELFSRLYAYAWPLFLVALPLLLGRTRANFTSSRAALLFLAMHLALSWTEIYLYPTEILVVAGVLYPLAWLLLSRTWHEPSKPHDFPIIEPAGML